jgi:hypothetical protein
MKYTVFFDQINRTNFQVEASDKHEATVKAIKRYRKYMKIPLASVEDGWISTTDGEDK